MSQINDEFSKLQRFYQGLIRTTHNKHPSTLKGDPFIVEFNFHSNFSVSLKLLLYTREFGTLILETFSFKIFHNC